MMDYWSSGVMRRMSVHYSITPPIHRLGGSSRRLRRRVMAHQQRNARLRPTVQGDVNRVKPRIIELQLLQVHNVIARAEMHVLGQRHFHRDGRELDRKSVV